MFPWIEKMRGERLWKGWGGYVSYMLAIGWRGLCERKSERIILAPHDLAQG